MMEDISFEKFLENKNRLMNLSVDLLVRYFNDRKLDIEDEDLIKILYKLEIMINYDSPNNN